MESCLQAAGKRCQLSLWFKTHCGTGGAESPGEILLWIMALLDQFDRSSNSPYHPKTNYTKFTCTYRTLACIGPGPAASGPAAGTTSPWLFTSLSKRCRSLVLLLHHSVRITPKGAKAIAGGRCSASPHTRPLHTYNSDY